MNCIKKRLNATETYVHDLIAERDQLSSMHREVTQNFALHSKSIKLNSTTQEERKQNIYILTLENKRLQNELQDIRTTVSKANSDVSSLSETERRLRVNIKKMREENNLLSESVSVMERKEREVMEQNDIAQQSLHHEKIKNENVLCQLRQKDIVM